MENLIENNHPATKKINILLSRHHDFLSGFIYYMTGRDYTHASIGVEGEDTYYSFNGKGFRIEQPKLWKHKDNRISATVYQIAVGQEEYQKTIDFINDIKENQKQYKYSFFGIFMCMLRIPYCSKKKYFCSQFVAEVLENAGILDTVTPPSLVLPNSLKRIFEEKLSFVKCYAYC